MILSQHPISKPLCLTKLVNDQGPTTLPFSLGHSQGLWSASHPGSGVELWSQVECPLSISWFDSIHACKHSSPTHEHNRLFNIWVNTYSCHFLEYGMSIESQRVLFCLTKHCLRTLYNTQMDNCLAELSLFITQKSKGIGCVIFAPKHLLILMKVSALS